MRQDGQPWTPSSKSLTLPCRVPTTRWCRVWKFALTALMSVRVHLAWSATYFKSSLSQTAAYGTPPSGVRRLSPQWLRHFVATCTGFNTILLAREWSCSAVWHSMAEFLLRRWGGYASMGVVTAQWSSPFCDTMTWLTHVVARKRNISILLLTLDDETHPWDDGDGIGEPPGRLPLFPRE